jgi:hypothetical protein
MRDGLVVVTAGAYGIYRVWMSHPLFQKECREFLARTPWDRSHPLPLAPIHLVPQDALILGVLFVLMLFRPAMSPAIVVTGFLFAYLVFLALTLAATNQPWYAWLTMFGLGLGVRLADWNPWAALLAVALTYPLTWQGVWRSLGAFPWKDSLAKHLREIRRVLEHQTQAASAGRAADIKSAEFALPWPWNVLSFDRQPRIVEPIHAWAWALQAGWWIYALCSAIPVPDSPLALAEIHMFATLWLLCVACGAGLIRLMTYCASHQSPLLLWGRIRTGRFLIPGYDVVAATPLAVLALGIVCYPTLAWLGCPTALASAITSTLLIGLSLTGRPRLRQWQLTAPARLMPLVRSKATVEAI